VEGGAHWYHFPYPGIEGGQSAIVRGSNREKIGICYVPMERPVASA